ncbi:MAG: 2-oxoacid:acceptor oxidoreductase family protein [Acidobacteriota bacterium]|nr:MAG: 2-oxoacid:acceptor oxidoreductase family protein [Acidobacteriota bacterium]
MYAKTYQKAKSFYGGYERKPGDHLTTHYCPGCGHGNLHKFIAEAIDDLGMQDRTIFINPVGCSVFAYYYLDFGNIQVPHGRAPASATAVKRAHPDSLVISYQGDGDLAAIGGNEILHAANRGENITVFFVNNAIYGMTGGQMAPTTLLGQKTITSPFGRSREREGFPLRVSEMLATLEGPTYIERVGLFDNKSRMKARKAIRKALRNQVEGRGFSLVEILSPCPTGWGLTPVESCEWINEEMIKVFPLGVLKDESATREGLNRYRCVVTPDQLPEILDLKTEAGEQFTAPEVPVCYRNPAIKIAGFGGQGLLFLGKLLAEAGMRHGYHVSWIPSYGPEMRGGTANCQVNISSEPIGSPLVSRPTVLIALNRPSLDKFEPEVASGGLLIYDSSLIDRQPVRDDLEVIALPATKLADEAGDPRAANMVALGAYLGRTKLLDQDAMLGILEKMTKNPDRMAINRQAYELGALPGGRNHGFYHETR